MRAYLGLGERPLERMIAAVRLEGHRPPATAHAQQWVGEDFLRGGKAACLHTLGQLETMHD